jgi:hypothetical protein
VLAHDPRAAHAPVFDRRMIEQMVISGLAIGLTAFFYYRGALAGGLPQGAAQGAVLWLLVWCENAHCFNCRSETRSIFAIPLAHNPLLMAGVAVTQLLQVAALGIAPLRDLLSLQSLRVADGLALAGAGLVILAVMELYKRARKG